MSRVFVRILSDVRPEDTGFGMSLLRQTPGPETERMHVVGPFDLVSGVSKNPHRRRRIIIAIQVVGVNLCIFILFYFFSYDQSSAKLKFIK